MMKGTQKSVLAGLAVALVFLFACHHRNVKGPGGGLGIGPGHGNHYGQEKDRQFDVSIYTYTDLNGTSYCSADWPVAALWRTDNQSVRWISDDDNQYTIDFSAGSRHKSPFKDSTPTIIVPANGEKKSGPLDDTAHGYYDFVILDAKNTPCENTHDPGYYVHP